ncbi:hypothetical protein [Kitasatospora sp. NPDC094011]|uniref:hypothetical protein n=1 Tax=Kitasatospora sp. NPDC094011 TaxID=3364090 RepID=UPI00381EA137
MSTGDGSDVVAAVVAALVQAASNTVGAAATALGGEAMDRVRDGLRRLPRWARAADRLKAAPDDGEAQRDVGEAVGELLSLDTGLKELLKELLEARSAAPGSASPPAPSSAIAFGDRSRIGGTGQTAVGSDITMAGRDMRTKTVHRHGSVGALIAVLAVVSALIALGIHLGSGHSLQFPGGSGNGGAGNGGGTTALGPEQVQAILPDLRSVPTGWTVESGPTTTTSCLAASGCEAGLQAGFRVIYDPSHVDPQNDHPQLSAYAYADAAAAGAAYQRAAASLQLRTDAREVALPGVGGSQSIAVTWTTPAAKPDPDRMNRDHWGSSMVLVGTVLVTVDGNHTIFGPSLDELRALTTALAARAREAQNGTTPRTAVARW